MDTLRYVRQWRIVREVHRPWLTVFETSAYLNRAKKLLSEEEQSVAIEMVARDPLCGDLIEGTGGIRKVRFAIGARGKSGGVRIIYYFHNDRMPVYLLAIFAKNEKANLSHAERNSLRDLVRILKEAHGRSLDES